MSSKEQTVSATMLRGTVVVHRRRCGKSSCRCASGEMLHESVVLSYSAQNRTRFVMLRPEEIESVRAATQRYRESKTALEVRAEAGLAALIAAHQEKRPAPSARRTRSTRASSVS